MSTPLPTNSTDDVTKHWSGGVIRRLLPEVSAVNSSTVSVSICIPWG